MNRFKWFLALSLISTHLFAVNTEHILWDKTPIHLNISLNEERLVHFPQAISIIDNDNIVDLVD